MAGLNKVLMIGRLGRDPEIRYTQGGAAICNMSVATSEAWTDKTTGEKKESVEWHRVVVFGKQAETCEKYLSKGSQIYIEGKLQTRTYDREGQTHYATEIVASNFQFLGGGQSGSTQGPPRGQNHNQQQRNQNPGHQNNQNNDHDDAFDDIPF